MPCVCSASLMCAFETYTPNCHRVIGRRQDPNAYHKNVVYWGNGHHIKKTQKRAAQAEKNHTKKKNKKITHLKSQKSPVGKTKICYCSNEIKTYRLLLFFVRSNLSELNNAF